MAVGDEAVAAGMAFVPDTGPDPAAMVRWGAREINRTRDYIAQTRAMIDAVWSIAKGGTGGTTKKTAREGIGISSGTGLPSGGEPGDIYFRILQ